MPDSVGDDGYFLEVANDFHPENMEENLKVESATSEFENDLALLFDEHNVLARFRTFVSERSVKFMDAFAATSA